MRKLCSKIIGLVSTLFFLVLFMLPASAVVAQSSASYTVTAKVPSPVSSELSTVKLNTDQTLADPVNHPILLTVKLLDDNKQPLPGRTVKVISDRGVADIIEATSKISPMQAHAAEIDAMQTDKTDDNGIASFRVTSFIPGEANFSVIADNVVQLPAQKVAFRPRPVPSYLSLSIYSPVLNKEWTIVPEKIQQQDFSPLQSEMAKSANFSLKVRIPVWLFLIILASLVGLVYFIIYTVREFRHLEQKDVELTEEISEDQAPRPKNN